MDEESNPTIGKILAVTDNATFLRNRKANKVDRTSLYNFLILSTVCGFLIFSSCQSKKTETAVTQSTEKVKTIENLDTLLARETQVNLAERKLSNIDLLRGYHSVKLGLNLDSIAYGSNWNVDSTRKYITIYNQLRLMEA